MVQQKLEVRGSVQLVVSVNGLEASLVFTREDSGRVWTAEVLSALIEDKQLANVQPGAVRAALERFAAAESGRITVTIARGTEPVPAVVDVPEWKPLPVPPELQRAAEETLAAAPAPSITVERVERVKRVKTVLKKPQLPFMPAREEKTVVWDKVVKTVPVRIDSRVLGIGFAEQGAVIAELKAGTNGKPGLDVLGNPLPVNGASVRALYFGAGIERRGNTLVAIRTGFVRKGVNWVDLVPFAHHSWSLSFSKDRATCLLSFTPGVLAAGLPRAAEVTARAAAEGYPAEYLAAPEEIDALIAEAFDAGQPLEAVSISRDRDAVMKLEVSEDKLEAHLVLGKGCGKGTPLDLRALDTLIRTSGLKGMKIDRIRTDILDFIRGPRFDLPSYELTRGTAPETGPDRTVRFLFDESTRAEQKTLREKLARLEEPERNGGSGPADPSDENSSLNEFPLSAVKEFACVKRGLEVAEITPAVPGKPGRDVYGAEIPGLPGTAPVLRLFENVRLEKDAVYAETDGILELGTAEDGATLFRIRQLDEVEVAVTISDDRMAAFLSIKTAPGRRVPREEVERAIAAAGVRIGLLEDAVYNAVVRAEFTGAVENELIARGVKPKDGQESRLKFHVTLPSEKSVTIRSDGSADFRTQNRFTLVREGEHVASVLPPVIAPEDGRDVTGAVIPARPSPPLAIQIGRNLRQEAREDGGFELYAGTTGELLYERGQIEIMNVHVVPSDLDFSCGNVKFPGTVLVKGSVLSGFHIVSGADIVVEQVVQAALVSAEGNIMIKLGVKGGGRGVLRTKKNIAAGFIEQAVVLSVGDIQLEKSCMLSRVKCNGRLVLTADRSILVGGSVKARNGVSVCNLGSETGTRTEISFGQDYLLADQIEIEEREIGKLRVRIAELDALMKRRERDRDRTGLEEIRREKLRALKAIEKRGFRLFNLREKFEEHYPSEVTVRGTLYPGVVIESHGRVYEVTAPRRAVKIVFDPAAGKIKELPLGGRNRA